MTFQQPFVAKHIGPERERVATIVMPTGAATGAKDSFVSGTYGQLVGPQGVDHGWENRSPALRA